jgi:ferredoxin
MKHLLMDPAFPDIVGEWARDEACRESHCSTCANDNHDGVLDELSDPLLTLVAKAEIEATRLW